MKAAEYKKCPKCGKNTLRAGQIAQSGKKRWECGTRGAYCYSTTNPDAPYKGKGEPEKKLVFKPQAASERLVITWAQNATPVHKGFLKALELYCATNNAQLLVIAGRYKNPTSHWSKSQRNEQYWEPEIVPYLVNARRALNKNLMLLAEIPIQPTAAMPLTGFEGITHGESGIFGHPKFQMNVIPTPHQALPKILTTTGAVTVPNYTDSKAGAKGKFHHVQGAVVVELEGREFFHLRHINARGDGAFCDLDKAYYPDGTVLPAGAYKALVIGDTHVRFTDPTNDKALFGKNGLVSRIDPRILVFHDLLDGYAVNPHHQGRPFIAVAKYKRGFSRIRSEIHEACVWLAERAKGREAKIIASNHNDFFARWMDRHDWRSDPENAEFYLETALHMVRTARIGPDGARIIDPFQYWASQLLANQKNIKIVGRNESLLIGGIECSLHGDQGPNGARGSRANLSKIGAKSIIAHAHAPGITDGCYQAGTSTPLGLEYTGAVGSWLNSHVSIDPMDKRHVHTMINEKFWG